MDVEVSELHVVCGCLIRLLGSWHWHMIPTSEPRQAGTCHSVSQACETLQRLEYRRQSHFDATARFVAHERRKEGEVQQSPYMRCFPCDNNM